jgi:hypothetical protein
MPEHLMPEQWMPKMEAASQYTPPHSTNVLSDNKRQHNNMTAGQHDEWSTTDLLMVPY